MNNASRLIDKTIEAVDGEIGSVHDLYFDDQTWTIRYLVADLGKWLPGRKVLIAPEAIVKPWHHQPTVTLSLTREQIQSSPEVDASTPPARAHEELLYSHYKWAPYWDSTLPSPAAGSLGSANELAGYSVQAGGEAVGHVEDLLVDDDLSRILFLVVQVKSWLFGKKVLAGQSLISAVDRSTSIVHVNANGQALKNAQEYKDAA